MMEWMDIESAPRDGTPVLLYGTRWRFDWQGDREAADAARKAKREAAELAERAIEAIRQIAAGHNDPRTLAMEVLNHPTRIGA